MGDEKSRDAAASPHDASGCAATAPGSVEGRILCVGGAALDTTFLAQRPVVAGTSNPATASRTFGGVARNIAENLARLGVETGLLSRVGDDENGRRLTQHLDSLGIDTAGIERIGGGRTAEYTALLEPDRTLSVGIADMAIFDRLDAGLLHGPAPHRAAAWIFIDCNCTPDLVNAVLDRSLNPSAKRAVDTVSVAKAERLPATLEGIDLLFLNLDEAASVLRIPRAGLAPERAIRQLQARGASEIVLTLGADGLLAAERSGPITPVHAAPAKVADVTGAGDALVATTLAAMLGGLSLPVASRWGCLAAALTVERVGSTRADLSFALLKDLAERMSSLRNETES